MAGGGAGGGDTETGGEEMDGAGQQVKRGQLMKYPQNAAMRLQSTQLLTCLPLFLQLLLMEGRMCGCFVFTRMCDRGNINKVLVVSNVMCRY